MHNNAVGRWNTPRLMGYMRDRLEEHLPISLDFLAPGRVNSVDGKCYNDDCSKKAICTVFAWGSVERTGAGITDLCSDCLKMVVDELGAAVFDPFKIFAGERSSWSMWWPDLARCIGCKKEIDLTIGYPFTCACGSVLFATPSGTPLCRAAALFSKERPMHIDWYLGKSSYSSLEKEFLVAEAKRMGSTWSWECDDCQEDAISKALKGLKSCNNLQLSLARLVGLRLLVEDGVEGP